MRALVDRADGYDVVLVAANKPDAPGLEWARSKGLPTWARESKGVPREEFDLMLSEAIEEHGAGTIALAGYMRILTPGFIDRWRGRIVNIHPSLLPKYPGLDTHARALAAGDGASGCTVHVVTEEVDAGEILGQAEVAVQAGDSPESLAERVLAVEHQLYPRTLAEFVQRCLQTSSNG